jgi:signal transduction histidine kinase
MRKIRNRVFVQILIPTTVLFLAIVVSGLVFVNRSFEEQVAEQKATELNNAARAVDNWIIARLSHLTQLAHTPTVRNEGREGALSFLRNEKERLGFIYSGIYYISRDGRYNSTIGEAGVLPNDELIAMFRDNDKPFHYTGPVLDSGIFSDSVLMAVPVRDNEENRLKAVLAATIPLETFRRVIGYFTLEEFDRFVLVNPRSVIITDSEATLAGASEQAEFGRSFSSSTRYESDMVFVSVMRTTWKLVAFIPTATALAPIRQVNQLVALFFLAVVLLVGTVSLAISAAIANPVRRLTDGVHQIMEGNYRQDITVNTDDELRELADAFNKLTQQMVRLRTDDQFAFLGHFSARIAHEMRKPLHIAQLAAQALKKESGSSQASNSQTGSSESGTAEAGTFERRVQLIENEIGNADRFIGEILNFARPETLNLSRYSPGELLDKIAKKYELVAQERGVELHSDIDYSIPSFYFDIIKMEQVFSNLLQNGIEAVEGCEPPRVVRISLYRARESACVSITDSGQGFDEELIDRVVDPYFTTKEEGTGIGLAIVYRIVAAHGGSFEVKNTPSGHGQVKVHFPLLAGPSD